MEKNCYPTEKINVNSWLIKGNENIGAKSLYGQVFISCRENDCKYVLKVLKNESHKKIEQEVKLQNECAKIGLCKKVEDWWLCDLTLDKGGVIITSILQYTVKELLKNGPTNIIEILNNIFKKLQKLHSSGIYHGDLHLNNMMVDDKDNIWFIDMGKAGYLDPNNINETIEYIKNDYKDVVTDIGVLKNTEELFEDLLNKLKDFEFNIKFEKLKKDVDFSDILKIEKEIWNL